MIDIMFLKKGIFDIILKIWLFLKEYFETWLFDIFPSIFL